MSSRTRSGLNALRHVSKLSFGWTARIVSSPRLSDQGSTRRSAPYKLRQRHACLLKQCTRARRFRQAYSCRELELFRLNIFARCEATFASADWNQMDSCGARLQLAGGR